MFLFILLGLVGKVNLEGRLHSHAFEQEGGYLLITVKRGYLQLMRWPIVIHTGTRRLSTLPVFLQKKLS